MAYKTLDTFLSDDDTDWSGNALERAKNRKPRKAAEAIPNTTPSLDLDKYVGAYNSKLYGDLNISIKDNKLFVKFAHTEIFKGYLNHFHYDTFELKFDEVPSLPKGKVTFSLNSKGEVASLLVNIPNPDFDFTELDFIKK